MPSSAHDAAQRLARDDQRHGGRAGRGGRRQANGPQLKCSDQSQVWRDKPKVYIQVDGVNQTGGKLAAFLVAMGARCYYVCGGWENEPVAWLPFKDFQRRGLVLRHRRIGRREQRV